MHRMKTALLTIGAALVATLVVAATFVWSDSTSTRAAPQGDSTATLDEVFASIAETVPGFGGAFYDDQGNLTMHLKDPTQQGRAEAAVRSALGQEVGERPIRVLTGQYDFRQLKGWHDSMLSLPDVPGVVLTDIDESKNRLAVGVEDLAITGAVRQELSLLGIPQQAVSIERTEPAVPLVGDTLRDKWRGAGAPAAGGIQISDDKGSCTLGFIALKTKDALPVKGFVTNAHCTPNMFDLDPKGVGAVIHQPKPANKLGEEHLDPALFGCGKPKDCRWSDSAFVKLNDPADGDLGKIKRPVNKNETNIDGDVDASVLKVGAKDFEIHETSFFALLGQQLHKVGQRTGWTQGPVTRTCFNENQTTDNKEIPNVDYKLLCQYDVLADVGAGDSGSPVFEIPDPARPNDVRLKGILWGGTDEKGDLGHTFVFSPLSGVVADLGALDVKIPGAVPFATPKPTPTPKANPCASQPTPVGGKIVFDVTAVAPVDDISDVCFVIAGTGGTIGGPVAVKRNPPACPDPPPKVVAGDDRIHVDWGEKCAATGDVVVVTATVGQLPGKVTAYWTNNGVVVAKTEAKIGHQQLGCPDTLTDKDGKTHKVAGCDEEQGTAIHTVNLTNPPLGILTCTGTGPTLIAKSAVNDTKSTDPSATPPKPTPNSPDGLDDIQTEIVSMKISGFCQPGNIPYSMTESTKFSSSGFIQEKTNIVPGKLEFPAASFFNVFVEIHTPIGNFHNQEPVGMFCQIPAGPQPLPPIGCEYQGTKLPVQLHEGNPNDPEKKKVGQIIAPTTHTLGPKPDGSGGVTGIYDVQIHAGDKSVGLFHCIARLDDNAGDVKGALQCYGDSPGLAPGSPLVDMSDLNPGPPPPPPYNATGPNKAFGKFAGGNLQLTTCIANIGGALGPNVIAVVDASDQGGGLLQGQVLIYGNQSIKQCQSRTPSGPAPDPLAINLYQAGTINQAPWRTSATDFDGDGCTDFQELDKNGLFKCGDDPYNPHDSDADANGPISVLATSIRADWDKVNDELIPGAYFYCLGHTDHNLATRAVVTTVVCTTDSPLLASAGGSAVPSHAVGLPGPPVPPPFGTGAPVVNTGSYDPFTNLITTSGCFPNVGGALGPNIITQSVVDIHTGEGEVDIFSNQSVAACDAVTPNGEPAISALLQVAPQPGAVPIGPEVAAELKAHIDFTPWDSDGDGCSDTDEVLGIGKCGDDPYNPYDSDTDFSGPSSTLATVIRADWDKEAGEPIPGAYFHCIANNIATGENTYDTPIYCYIDIPGVLVNPEASPLSGDGLPGSPPPLPYGDVDDNHSVLSTVYNKQTNRLLTEGCFLDEDGQGALGWVYVRSDIDAHTGLGTVDIFAGQPADCSPQPTGPPGLVGELQTAEQPPDWDSDLDGCTDAQELGPFQSAGGLRDPFNQWDLMDTWATGSQTRNVDGFDIGDVVVRFGQVGDPTGDPHEEPTANNNYHTAADRSSPILGANPWNLPGPSGNIDGFDIGAVVVQFGHTCVQ